VRSNVAAQRQPGYVHVTLTLPLGDLTSDQGRALADVVRKYTGDTLRTTAEQNLLLRWVSEADLPALYQDLVAINLAEAGASTITDITACPGTDTCKLGISSSRALAAELRHQLVAIGEDERTRHLHIKASGCFNSCGQHHVADIGYLGVSRNVNGRRVPHFQLVIGGQWQNNAGSYGLAIGAIPSKRVPEFTKRITALYAKDKTDGETFAAFTTRIGKKTIRAMVEEMQPVPAYEADPSFYSDWGDPREYTINDMGVGECAGEVVPYVEMGLATSEREIFEAQVMLDEGNVTGAGRAAYNAMLTAARALAREKNANIGNEPDEIVQEFRTHLYDTKLFWDTYAGGKFGQYFFRAHEERGQAADKDAAHQMIEEAQLFVDAAHQCYTQHGATLAAPTITVAP
jgi:sulfite reductase (ferredoxin)